ncbi:hypothetical protein MGU_06588 [Metarhizium guizhouense ARSEF 977]|uniref:Uncharacterized protein n=1 Tax=Metarhizium guizhouense (strain ARSEF 977) TaxID=1276136 RepID=A0A0B4GGJ4_METGA|nr:hypothetical protein MGU_06588 [Metarhizium guizhouense ARSEF 977]
MQAKMKSSMCGNLLSTFYMTRSHCIEAARRTRTQRCPLCRTMKTSCGETWERITTAIRLSGKKYSMPETVLSFATMLDLLIHIYSRPEDAYAAVDGVTMPTDRCFGELQKQLQSFLRLDGSNTVQLLLHGAVGDMGYEPNHQKQLDPTAVEMYTSLLAALIQSRSHDASLKTPLLRSAASLRISGEVTLAMVLFASCWFSEYDPSSVPPVIKVWCAWLPSRQSDDQEAGVNPEKHMYVGAGPHDARDELPRHNGRGVVNFALRSMVPRAHHEGAWDVAAFRDVMAFRSGILVADCVSRDNRDIAAFIQVAGQFPALLDPSETRDVWSGHPIVHLGRAALYIRQIKHLVVCSGRPRDMGIVYGLLYALSSPRHNKYIRGLVSPSPSQSVVCCPAPFCGADALPCDLDRPLPVHEGGASTNPVRLLVASIVQEGLDAEAWQENIDRRLRLCHEWSRGLHGHLGPYDPVSAARAVAPTCIRILMRIARLCGCDMTSGMGGRA